ncbi:hypothetical protein CF319_g7159 [Tilletia indica]|nr:hypothetical protein CF319_g7159 [Tilletia indica]
MSDSNALSSIVPAEEQDFQMLPEGLQNDPEQESPTADRRSTSPDNEDVLQRSHTSEPAIKKRHVVSEVWEYFDLAKRENGTVPCKKCSVRLASKDDNSSGTKHLKRHADRCFGLQIEVGQQRLAFSKTVDTKIILDALLVWIANDQQAFLAVEHPAFIAFCRALNPQVVLPSADTIYRRLMARYDLHFSKVKKMFAKLDSKISLTTDGWTAPNGEPYLSITAHWITPEWEHQSCLLAFLPFPAPHSALNAFEIIWDKVKELEIHRKILACVTDNTGSAYNISEHLETAVSPSPFFKVRCAAHLLQLAIKNGMKDADANVILEPVRSFCTKVRRSTPLSQKLEAMCKRTGEVYHRPRRDMEVRWNSTYTLIEGLIPMETAMTRLFRDDSDFKDIAFGNSTWKHLRDIIKILAPFARATEFVQGLKFPTLGIVAQAVDYLVHRMAAMESDSSVCDWANTLALHIGSNLSGYLPVLLDRPATQFSAALHATVKLSLAGQAQGASQLEQDLCAYLLAHYPSSSSLSPNPPSSSSSAQPDFLDLLHEHQGLSSTDAMGTEQQLNHYLGQERSVSKESPLHYWRANAKALPSLARMARDLLAIPASTAASESSFSRGKLLISDRRNSLSSSTVSKMMCLDNWTSVFGADA